MTALTLVLSPPRTTRNGERRSVTARGLSRDGRKGKRCSREARDTDRHSWASKATRQDDYWRPSRASSPSQRLPVVPQLLIRAGSQLLARRWPSRQARVVPAPQHRRAGSSVGGLNVYGELGIGPTEPKSTPVAVKDFSGGVATLALGQNHSCAATEAGAAKCWGNNFFGQLGDASTTNRTTPSSVSGLPSGVTALSANTGHGVGEDHTCAVVAGGAKCWGFGSRRLQPAQVPAHPRRMLPGLNRHAAGGRAPNASLSPFWVVATLSSKSTSPSFSQHAIPTGSISQVHSDRQLLALPIPFPIPDSNAILLHCRSPFDCTIECVIYSGA